jgi:hypothetical protein
MDTGHRLRVARLLVLVQLVLALVSVAEVAALAAFGLFSPSVALVAVAHAVLLGLAARSLRRGGRLRVLRVVEVLVLLAAGAELLLGAWLGAAPLLMAVLVRVLLPLAVLALVRPSWPGRAAARHRGRPGRRAPRTAVAA